MGTAIFPDIACYREPAQSLLRGLEALMPQVCASPPRDISGCDVLGVPVHLSLRTPDLQRLPFDRLKEWGQLEWCSHHQGKGVTAAQSQVSCMMEVIERYSAAAAPAAHRMQTGTRAEIGSMAVDPACLYLPDNVRYDPGMRLAWYCDRDCVSGCQAAVPVDFVLLDLPDSAYPFPGFETTRLGFHLSSGLAAGTSLDDALLAGVCEAVERDAQYRLATGTGPPFQELALDSDPDFSRWQEHFSACGLTLRACVDRHPAGLATVCALSWDPYCKLLVSGTACAVQLRQALQQAILEIAQQRAFLFFWQWKTRREYFPIVRYIKEQIHPGAYRDSVPPDFWGARGGTPVPIAPDGEPTRSLAEVVERLEAAGHRVIGFDLTQPALAIPVARVLVTGLQNGYFVYQAAWSFLREQHDTGTTGEGTE